MIELTKEDFLEWFKENKRKRSAFIYENFIDLFHSDRLSSKQIAGIIFEQIQIAVPLSMIGRIRKKHTQNLIDLLPASALIPVDASIEQQREDYYPMPVSLTYEPWECLFNFACRFTLKQGA